MQWNLFQHLCCKGTRCKTYSNDLILLTSPLPSHAPSPHQPSSPSPLIDFWYVHTISDLHNAVLYNCTIFQSRGGSKERRGAGPPSQDTEWAVSQPNQFFNSRKKYWDYRGRVQAGINRLLRNHKKGLIEALESFFSQLLKIVVEQFYQIYPQSRKWKIELNCIYWYFGHLKLCPDREWCIQPVA